MPPERFRNLLPLAAAAVVSMTGADQRPIPQEAPKAKSPSSAVEHILQKGRTTTPEGLHVSVGAQAIVDMIVALPTTETKLSKPLTDAIKANAFDIAKLISRYGERAAAPAVVECILATEPNALFQDTEYLEKQKWGGAVLERLVALAPQSSIDFGLYDRNIISESEDPTIRILLDLRIAVQDPDQFWRASLFIDDLVNKRRTQHEVLSLVSDDNSYIEGLKQLKKRGSILAKNDIENELGVFTDLGR